MARNILHMQNLEGHSMTWSLHFKRNSCINRSDSVSVFPTLYTLLVSFKSVKDERVMMGSQSVPTVVLSTVPVEVEGIHNLKPLGYISSDLDPVTHLLSIGRWDASLSQNQRSAGLGKRC